MNIRDIVLNYLTDNEKGMQQLITWFLNDVMNEEVAKQAGVPRHARSSSRRAHWNGYRARSLRKQMPSKQGFFPVPWTSGHLRRDLPSNRVC